MADSAASAGKVYLSGVRGVLFACVGKPSAGKSTFLNAIAENAKAKVGAFPFTTIGTRIDMESYNDIILYNIMRTEADGSRSDDSWIRKIPFSPPIVALYLLFLDAIIEY